jgi:hypothetical protein
MSKTDPFWQYAREVMLSACYGQTDEAKQGLLELARTWTQAALRERESCGRSRKARLDPLPRPIPTSGVIHLNESDWPISVADFLIAWES